MSLKLTVLGSGGWAPSNNRLTCSYLVEWNHTLILLDAGTGVSRLQEYQHLLDAKKEVHVILSHYHLDHIIGLSFLPMFLQKHHLHIWAPSAHSFKKAPQEILQTIISFPFSASHIETFAKTVSIHEYTIESFCIQGLHVSITPQVHRGPSFGITLGSYLHYATDTIVLEETFKIASNVKLLLHECWEIDGDKRDDHSLLSSILEARRFCPNVPIGLIHLNPTWTQETFHKVEQIIKHTPIFITHDTLQRVIS